MTMHPTDYREVAAHLKVTMCQGCSAYTDRQHRMGIAEPRSGTIHWRDRHITRPGMRNFLKLYAYILFAHQRPGIPLWKKLWEENTLAYQVARREFHMLIPAHLSREDRHRALASAWQGAIGGPRLTHNIGRSAWTWINEEVALTSSTKE